MTSADTFPALMTRLRAGDDDAASQVFSRFASQILDLARQKLHGSMRRKIDPEDVLQSVFRSFFVRHRQGRFDIENWDNLWGILLVMTLRKCHRRMHYHQADRRDLRREVSLGSDSAPEVRWDLVAHGPTPAEAAVLTELVTCLMQALRPDDRGVLSMHLQGYTVAEISERNGCSVRTIHRALDRIKDRLRRMQVADGGGG
jgi:RNA polymerase sigma-70 factor (ECF subfamily)